MKKFISLSQYPGRTGQYFYTRFFEYYDIDAAYEPKATANLAVSIAHALEEKISGISVSMPFKQEVIKFLDDTSSYVDMYQSCNTIIVDNNKLKGYNTDIAGVEWACKQIDRVDRITILGSGAMASMFVRCLEEDNYGKMIIAARSLNTWEQKDTATDVVINATSYGTATKNSPYTALPKNVKMVIDLAIKENDLMTQCLDAGVKYVSGKEFYKQQFLAQFKIYTGITADSDLFDKFESEQHERI